jgi:hypothetical protein
MTENLEVFLVLKDGTTIKISGEASVLVVEENGKPLSTIEEWFKNANPGDMRIEKDAKVALKKL